MKNLLTLIILTILLLIRGFMPNGKISSNNSIRTFTIRIKIQEFNTR